MQTLAHRERVNRKGETVPQRVPAARLALLDRREVALDKTLVFQRTEALKVSLSDALAGFGKTIQRGLAGKLFVQSKQFAEFIAAGMAAGVSDGGQFERE